MSKGKRIGLKQRFEDVRKAITDWRARLSAFSDVQSALTMNEVDMVVDDMEEMLKKNWPGRKL